MDVYEAIGKRRSIRRYRPDDVPESVLRTLLNAARLAPSACNRQAWKLIVVRDKETKKRIAESCRARFPGPDSDVRVMRRVAEAPLIIVACVLVRDANMKYYQLDGEDAVTFSNRGRRTNQPGFWQEFIEHRSSHKGEYESMGIWDLAIALDHLSLSAIEQGLGTCWIGFVDGMALKRILSIPAEAQARMAMTVGYPDESPEPRSRKQLDELVSYEKYE
jgi:nitroreductase